MASVNQIFIRRWSRWLLRAGPNSRIALRPMGMVPGNNAVEYILIGKIHEPRYKNVERCGKRRFCLDEARRFVKRIYGKCGRTAPRWALGYGIEIV